MKSNSINFRNPLKLLAVYRFIESYIAKHTDSPSHEELIEAGFASSPSVIAYYYDLMSKLNMIAYTPRRPRSVHLLPLDKAHPAIKTISEHEWVEMTAYNFLRNHLSDGVALIGQYEWVCLGHTGTTFILFSRVATTHPGGSLQKFTVYVKPDRLVYWRRNKKGE